MMEEDERLRDAVRWRKKPARRTRRLGDSLSEVMEGRIGPQQAKYGRVAELWGQLLPEGFEQHCRIVDLSGGQLKVAVDSPSYLHELRLCSYELVKELGQQCPAAHIKKIKFVVG